MQTINFTLLLTAFAALASAQTYIVEDSIDVPPTDGGCQLFVSNNFCGCSGNLVLSGDSCESLDTQATSSGDFQIPLPLCDGVVTVVFEGNGAGNVGYINNAGDCADGCDWTASNGEASCST